MNYMPAIGAHNKYMTPTKLPFFDYKDIRITSFRNSRLLRSSLRNLRNATYAMKITFSIIRPHYGRPILLLFKLISHGVVRGPVRWL